MGVNCSVVKYKPDTCCFDLAVLTASGSFDSGNPLTGVTFPAVNVSNIGDVVTAKFPEGLGFYELSSLLVWEFKYFVKSLIQGDATTIGSWEGATVTEADAGISALLVMSVDTFAGSDFGTKSLQIRSFNGSSAVTTGDGILSVTIPPSMDGYNLVNVLCSVEDKGITGTTNIVARRWRAGVAADMLSTAVTIGDEWFAEDGVIDATNDDVITGDRIYVDVDTIHSGTAPNGLDVVLEFRKP